MRAQEFLRDPRLKNLRPWRVKLRLRQPGGHTMHMDTTIMARNADQARRIIRQQYNNKNVLVGNPREIR